MPYKNERNDPFLSNDKTTFKKNKENISESDSDSTDFEHMSRKKKKKYFNKPGFSKFPKNSPFNPKGFNKNKSKDESNEKPSFKPSFKPNFEDNKKYQKEEKMAERTETESSEDNRRQKIIIHFKVMKLKEIVKE